MDFTATYPHLLEIYSDFSAGLLTTFHTLFVMDRVWPIAADSSLVIMSINMTKIDLTQIYNPVFTNIKVLLVGNHRANDLTFIITNVPYKCVK